MADGRKRGRLTTGLDIDAEPDMDGEAHRAEPDTRMWTSARRIGRT